MKKIGTIIIVISILLALYFGLWTMFIGGIMAIAKAWDTSALTATFVAWNIIKIVLAAPVGWFIFAFGTLIGTALIKE
ncbi:TPA: hypothetical protein I9094_001671 [Clostridium perfringens]|nr:hypothetical protein [Clostridium perfringens]HAT4346345.1 hypothetical protein [Clostridium perfringens]